MSSASATASTTSATTYPPPAAPRPDPEASTTAAASPPTPPPASKPRRALETGKEKFKRWIDYEPHVIEAAPVDEYLRRSTHINYPKAAAAYVHRLFPFTNVSGPEEATEKACLLTPFRRLQWILHYNTRWLIGDLIAGLTVGMVLVPQAMVRPPPLWRKSA